MERWSLAPLSRFWNNKDKDKDNKAVTVAGASAASVGGLEWELWLQVQGLGYVGAAVDGSGFTAIGFGLFINSAKLPWVKVHDAETFGFWVYCWWIKSSITLITLNDGNYGIFLIVGTECRV